MHLQLLGPVAPLPVLAPSLSAPCSKGYPTHISCGPLRRVPKICLAIGDKMPPRFAFDDVAILQSDESFANPGRQGLPQRREACVDGWSGSDEVLRQHLSCHVFQALCSDSLLQWSVVRHIKLFRERCVVWRDVGQMNPGQLLFSHLNEGCRNVGWRTIKDENAGAHHQARALQNPERRAGSLLCSSGFSLWELSIFSEVAAGKTAVCLAFPDHLRHHRPRLHRHHHSHRDLSARVCDKRHISGTFYPRQMTLQNELYVEQKKGHQPYYCNLD